MNTNLAPAQVDSDYKEVDEFSFDHAPDKVIAKLIATDRKHSTNNLPSAKAKELLSVWQAEEDDENDSFDWWAEYDRQLADKKNQVVILGDMGSPEMQSVLTSEITTLNAPTTKTKGHEWKLGTRMVNQLISKFLSQHPVEEEKDGRAFAYARSVSGKEMDGVQYGYRNQDAIEAVTAFVGDIDGTDKARRIANRIHELGYAGVVYTTHSHPEKKTEHGDRCRFIIFLDEPFQIPNAQEIDPPRKGQKSKRRVITEERREAIAEYHARYAGMCAKLGLDEIDASAMNLHHMQYTPRRASEDAEFEHYIIAGRALRIEDMPLGDPSKYRKEVQAPSGANLSAKKSSGRVVLFDGFEIAPWWEDGGRFIMGDLIFEMLDWDVRGYNGGWTEIQCPNCANHSDPNDDAAAFIDGDDGFGFNCFHDHCANIGTWEMFVLIDQAIQDGEIDLPDGFESLSQLLCDPCLFPDNVDGEELEFDAADYGVREEIEIQFLGSPKKVQKAFNAVAHNDRAGDDHYAALYAGVAKAGNKHPAVAKLDELMTAHKRHDANKRKALNKLGNEMVKAEREAWKAQKNDTSRREAEDALERYDLANPSMDPAEPLGSDMKSSLATLRNRYAVCDLNGKFRVVRRPDMSAFNSALNSTVIIYGRQDFEDLHMNRKVKSGDSWVNPAETFLECEKRKSGLVFAPPPLMPGENDFNMYLGRKLEPVTGSWDTIHWFIRHIVCDGCPDKYAWLLLWMADLVQNPGRKPGTAIVGVGNGGVGKGTFGKILMKLTAPHCKELENEEHVTGRFAGEHLSKCILTVVNEAVFGLSPKVSSKLKALVDSKTIQAETKGMNVETVPSYTRFYFDSNDAVPVLIEGNNSERRYFVIRFSDAKMGDQDYFKKLHQVIEGEEMAAFLDHLLQYEPASAGMSWNDVRTGPETPERNVMGWHSMPATLRRLKEVLGDGEVTLRLENTVETFVTVDGRLRVPITAFRDHIGSLGKGRAEDRDVPAMFERLFPELALIEGRGRVGDDANGRYWEFPREALGVVHDDSTATAEDASEDPLAVGED
ncbi:MAG: primase-helicase family protein [Pseudomonadota bacterium]